MKFGLDLLGAARFAEVAVRAFPEGFALGLFSNTFGDSLPVARRLLRAGKCNHVRVQLLWSDNNHTYTDRDVPEMIREAKKWEELARNFAEATIELSPFCEHNLQTPDKYLDMVKESAPSCVPVNSPWNGAISRKYKNEKHGPSAALKRRYNYSFDGTSAVDADVEMFKARHAGAEVFFLWVPQFNGKRNVSDTTPRPDRVCWPSKEHIESAAFLATQGGEAKLPPRGTWKSHADDQVPDHPRELKNLLLVPEQYTRVELVARSGEVVASAPRDPVPFEDGRWRYYFGSWGYKNALKIKQITGQKIPYARIRADGKFIGRVNPAFRAGDFRNN